MNYISILSRISYLSLCITSLILIVVERRLLLVYLSFIISNKPIIWRWSCPWFPVASGFGPNQDNNPWQNVWKRKVPNVVKMFLWRALNDLLPTKDNLYRKGVLKESSCPVCGVEEETVFHAIFGIVQQQGMSGRKYS
jgi:hypothetical protein